MFKLLSLVPGNFKSGVHWYRQIQFFKEANKQELLDCKFIDFNLPVDILTKVIDRADAYFVLGIMSMLDVYSILLKAPANKPLIVDIDDRFDLVSPFSNSYAAFGTEEIVLPNGVKLWEDGEAGFSIERNKKNIKNLEKILKRADLIITTTIKITEWLSSFNKKVVAIPNSIDFDIFPCIKQKKDNIVRVGWAGGSSHFADLMTILPSLKKIMEKYPQVHFFLIGQYYGVIEKYIPKSRLHYYEWINADGHGYRLATLNLDIGLCPLTDDEFNLYKSNIKFYEYSAIKIPTLAKNMLPYNEEIIDGDTGYLYNNAAEFEKKLEFLIFNPLKRRVVAENAFNFVLKYRNLKKVVKDWAEVINSVIRLKNK